MALVSNLPVFFLLLVNHCIQPLSYYPGSTISSSCHLFKKLHAKQPGSVLLHPPTTHPSPCICSRSWLSYNGKRYPSPACLAPSPPPNPNCASLPAPLFPLARAWARSMHRSKRISWGLWVRRLPLPFQRRQAWASISGSAGRKNRQRRGAEGGGGEEKSWEGGGGGGAREGWVTWRGVLSFWKRRAELSSPQYRGERQAVLKLGHCWGRPAGAAPPAPGQDAAEQGVSTFASSPCRGRPILGAGTCRKRL